MANPSSSASTSTTNIEALVQRLVQQELERQIPHECMTCRWFQLSKTPPRNRYCQNPNPVVLKGGVCQLWELEPDPQMRSRGFC